jgi:hypothetical protein
VLESVFGFRIERLLVKELRAHQRMESGRQFNAKNPSEARKILNERLGQVARGETPAAVSKVRIAELHTDMVADCKNKGQDLETLAVRWKHLEPVFGSDPVRVITHARMQA